MSSDSEFYQSSSHLGQPSAASRTIMSQVYSKFLDQIPQLPIYAFYENESYSQHYFTDYFCEIQPMLQLSSDGEIFTI